MPAVLVHGVPDTAELFDPLVARLARDDVVRVRLPGFDAPVPPGFTSTKDEYAEWLADELAAIGEPVDLVGHDWGSLLTQRVATTRPELVRSFVSDGAVSSTFRWHELAKQWQTPGLGEEIMQLMTPEAVAALLRDARHPDPDGAGAHVDEAMKTAVLALYRSAVDIAEEWAPPSTTDGRPALVVWGAGDLYGPPSYGRAAAELAHAEYVELDAGHWALVERPAEAAAAIESFWAGL